MALDDAGDIDDDHPSTYRRQAHDGSVSGCHSRPKPHHSREPSEIPESQTTFRWSTETRVWSSGQEIFLTDAPRDREAQDLLDLRRLICSGAEFLVTDHGVDEIQRGINAAQGFFQCQSGGSTGVPKSVRRTQASWVASFEVNRNQFGLSGTDRFAVLGRLVYSLSLYAVLEAAQFGAEIHLMAGLRPARQLATLAAQGVSLLYATPTQLRLLVAAAETPYVLPALRQILCGGGALSRDIRARIQILCPNATLTEFYGASETSFITLTEADTPMGSVGRAYPGVEIKVEPEDSSGVGEVWVKSPYLFDSYARGSSAATRWRDGFLSVGELGFLDARGALFLSGRKNRMVTIADQNVFPEEVEALLQSYPEVTHCAVVAIPDVRRGHVLLAVVSGTADKGLTDELLRRCRNRLGPLKAPRQLMVLKEFPLLPSGKPDLRAIVALVEART